MNLNLINKNANKKSRLTLHKSLEIMHICNHDFVIFMGALLDHCGTFYMKVTISIFQKMPFLYYFSCHYTHIHV